MAKPSQITSRQNPRVKDAAKLRSGRERKRQRRFLIDGAREIHRAVGAGIRCAEAFVCDELCDSVESAKALAVLEKGGAEILWVAAGVYAKLAFGERLDGIVVVAETPQRGLDHLTLPTHPLVVVLESVEKPGNVGAILRSADAAGVDAVIVADGRTDLYNPNTIRASLGTVFRDNVCSAASDEALKWLRDKEFQIIAARPDAETPYTAVDFRRDTAIVLGSEAEGLSEVWRGANVTAVRLPMCGIADSLNVSTTAAVLFYESLRQRSQP